MGMRIIDGEMGIWAGLEARQKGKEMGFLKKSVFKNGKERFIIMPSIRSNMKKENLALGIVIGGVSLMLIVILVGFYLQFMMGK